MKLTKLIELYTQLQSRVLSLETTKANQALEIGSLKRKVKKIEKKASKKTHKLKILYKIGSSTRMESSKDAGLSDQEDASKQERMIEDLNADEGVALKKGLKYLLFLRFVQVFLDSQVKGMLKHKEIYVTPSHTKKNFANMKRQEKTFLKQKSKKSKKRITKVPHLSESTYDVADEHVTITSNDLLSGEDRMKLTKLIELYTQLQSRVLSLETTKANQALEIGSLKRKVKKIEKKASKKTHKLKILYKIGSSTRMESSKDAGLSDQEDASKQERMIEDLNADEGVALVDET
nr:hypothetical protein [Tanacetum cinerariifolium]